MNQSYGNTKLLLRTCLCRSILLISLIILAGFSELRAQELQGYVVWKPIAVAQGYRIQIRLKESKKILVNKIVKKNYHLVRLAQGDFQVRTGPLNKFQKPIVWSYWHPLQVVATLIPEIKSNQVQEKDGQLQIGLRGQNFLPVTGLRLENGERRLTARDVQVNSAGTILMARIKRDRAKPGTYDLIVSNPGGKSSRVQSFLEIPAKGIVAKGIVTKTEVQGNEPRGLSEFRAYIKNLKRSCSRSDLPDILIKECHQYYITLDLTTARKRNLYYFIKMTRENAQDRQMAYNYFRSSCQTDFTPGQALMNHRLQRRSELFFRERDTLERALHELQDCP